MQANSTGFEKEMTASEVEITVKRDFRILFRRVLTPDYENIGLADLMNGFSPCNSYLL